MLDHVSIQCRDVASSRAFYDAVLAPIGYGPLMEFPGVVGYGADEGAEFWISAQSTGDGFRETHIAFTAPNRAAVRAFVEAAHDAGLEVLHEPREWPEYHPDYFGGFVRDPDGNNVEAVCHLAE